MMHDGDAAERRTSKFFISRPTFSCNIVPSTHLINMSAERTSLIDVSYTGSDDIASQMSGMLGKVILGLQIVAAVVIFLLFSYDSVDEFTTQKYIIFRDIMVMLLLGFGYRK